MDDLLPNIIWIAPQVWDAERDDPLVVGLVARVVVLVLRQVGVPGPDEASLQKFWNTEREWNEENRNRITEMKILKHFLYFPTHDWLTII